MDGWTAVDAGGALGEEVRVFQILDDSERSFAVVHGPFQA